MRAYRQIRTITGQKVFVRESREERIQRNILRAEMVLAPLVMILVFAAAGGMLR